MYLLDANKIKKEFNWESKFSLEKGIEKNINWVNQNLKFLNKEKLIYIHKK
jgi:dTDP-D-glucose 4,6-dehydratase